jgi:NADP-dependent 3-hydroxy acid dehydrogenase YdfG
MTESVTKGVALVTGASRGIGRAIALALAQEGWRVIGTATSESGAAGITEALAAHGGRGIMLNVTDAAASQAAVDDIVTQEGGLHVLVNNAGITRDTLSMRMKDDDWDAVLDTNLKAVFRLARAATKPMMKQRSGRIINITSVVGASGNAGQANYAGPRAGQPRHHCQLRRAGLHRHRHDRGAARGPEGRAAGADPAGPPGRAGGDRRSRRLPGVTRRCLHHRHRAARQRRHVHGLIGPGRADLGAPI